MTSGDSQKVGKMSKKSSKSPKNDHRSASSPADSVNSTYPKIALVCDWLTTTGGAEKVLLELHHMYPEAPIYTSQYSKKGINWFDDADVRTGWLQIFPKSLRKFLGPLRQLYFSHLDLTSYDLVISVTGAEAKSIKAQKHLSYCHVPTQYYWQMYDKYIENPGFGILNPLVRLVFRLLVKPLRQADYNAAQLPDQFITISSHAQAQIKKYYHRDAVVIAPPVEVAKFARNPQAFPPQSSDLSTPFPQKSIEKSTKDRELSTEKRKKSTNYPQEIHKKSNSYPPKTTTFPQFIHKQAPTSPQSNASYPQVIHKLSTANPKLSTSYPQNQPDSSTAKPLSTTEPYYIISCRQVTWKRVDLAIEACKSAKLPLKVVGSGPEHNRLLKLANDSPNIELIPWLDARELAHLLQGATAYLFPSLEPFGIAPVEALAAGCPVIAYHEGGSRDFVIKGKNGLFFDQQTPESLIKALQKFQTLTFDRDIVAQSAEKFSSDHFRQQISRLIAKVQSTPSNPSSKSQPPRKESNP